MKIKLYFVKILFCIVLINIKFRLCSVHIDSRPDYLPLRLFTVKIAYPPDHLLLFGLMKVFVVNRSDC